MAKNKVRGFIILAIILVVFSIIAFVIPFSKTATFWIAYVFGVIAIAYQIYVFNIAFTNGEDAKSKFYGFPIAKIGAIYLIVQLVISLALICLAKIMPVWASIIINIIPIAVASIGCITADVMRDEIVQQDIQIKTDVSNMRSLQSLSAAIVGQCQDEAVKLELQKLSDEFRYSDPVSSEATKELENSLENKMKELQKFISDGDYENVKTLCNKVSIELSERNRVCALNK